ncbi:MAG TPA: prepilin-type N-terminal cleavage/methylation domain-containing protein [Pyrinomonadaceae bacterium]|nr:prepilin-type N-terminal cleavage/methylation domain-containing protein [Pyrinomonadaceae bacterium]
MRKNLNRPAPKLAQQRRRRAPRLHSADGFSLVELTIAMAIVLVMMAGASHLLMSSLGVRTRESQKSDALADAQRALNIMSREIGNSGFGLDYNGLVAPDCHPSNAGDPNVAQIRLRANVDNSNKSISDPDEDVTFVYQGTPTRAIVRYDAVSQTSTVLAGEIDAVQITYIDAAGGASNLATGSAVANAVRVRITIQVNLQQTVGQPASQVLLTSEIALRNAPAVIGHY